MPQLKLGNIQRYSPSDISQLSKLQARLQVCIIKVNIQMEERLGFMTEEYLNLLVDRVVSENTKNQLHALEMF